MYPQPTLQTLPGNLAPQRTHHHCSHTLQETANDPNKSEHDNNKKKTQHKQYKAMTVTHKPLTYYGNVNICPAYVPQPHIARACPMNPSIESTRTIGNLPNTNNTEQ